MQTFQQALAWTWVRIPPAPQKRPDIQKVSGLFVFRILKLKQQDLFEIEFIDCLLLLYHHQFFLLNIFNFLRSLERQYIFIQNYVIFQYIFKHSNPTQNQEVLFSCLAFLPSYSMICLHNSIPIFSCSVYFRFRAILRICSGTKVNTFSFLNWYKT